jgi:hypothetical protein
MADAGLTLGLVSGALWMYARIRHRLKMGPIWRFRWFRQRGTQGDRRMIRRLRQAMVAPPKLFALPFFLSIVPFLVLWSFGMINSYSFADTFESFGLGVLLSSSTLVVLALAFDKLNPYCLQAQRYAAMEVARRLHPDVAVKFLAEMANGAWSGSRLAVVDALRAVGTPSAMDLLQYLIQDQAPEVADRAGLARIERLALTDGKTETKIIPVINMPALALTHRRLVGQIFRRKAKRDRIQHAQELDLVMQQMDELVFSQLAVRRSFPDVYCKTCYARAELLAYEGWDWLRCKQCHEADGLVPGVREVIGQIGAAEDWVLHEGTLRVHLWNEAKRVARLGEIASLEVAAGHAITYDWAVSAVVELFHKHHPQDRATIPVQVVGDPGLEPNTLQLLKTIDSGFKWPNEAAFT